MAKYYFEKWSLEWNFPSTYFQDSDKVRKANGLQIINFDGSVRIAESANDFQVGDIFASSVMDFEQFKQSNIEAYLYLYVKPFNTSAEIVYKQHRLNWTEVQSHIKKTQLIERVKAEENELPENGILGDYWYIRGEKAFPTLSIKTANSEIIVGGVHQELYRCISSDFVCQVQEQFRSGYGNQITPLLGGVVSG